MKNPKFKAGFDYGVFKSNQLFAAMGLTRAQCLTLTEDKLVELPDFSMLDLPVSFFLKCKKFPPCFLETEYSTVEFPDRKSLEDFIEGFTCALYSRDCFVDGDIW